MLVPGPAPPPGLGLPTLLCLAADDDEDGGCDESESHPDPNESSEYWSDAEWLGDQTGVNVNSALGVLGSEGEE